MRQRKRLNKTTFERSKSVSHEEGNLYQTKKRFESIATEKQNSMQEKFFSTLVRKEFTEAGKPRKFARRRVFFVLGSLLGALIPILFIFYTNPDLPIFNKFADFVSLKLDEIELGTYFDGRLFEDMFGNWTSTLFPEKNNTVIDLTPGLQLLTDYNAKPKHPVIFIPGIITTVIIYKLGP